MSYSKVKCLTQLNYQLSDINSLNSVSHGVVIPYDPNLALLIPQIRVRESPKFVY